MTRLLSRLRNEDGQVLVLVTAAMLGVIAMTAFVVDVGSWFHQQRATQSTVDAAALAGAQALPADTALARTLAKQYASKNGAGGTIADSDITFASTYAPNDTIKVSKAQSSPDFFGKVFGFSAVTVHAHATAMVAVPKQALYVAPIGVNILHPDLKGTPGCPCFGPSNQTTLPLGKTGAPGAFDLINLDGSRGGTSPGTLADWMLNGYQKYLPLGGYYSDPGAKFNASAMQSALTARKGTDLLFPVYDTLTGNGANASYNVIAWVGFHLIDFDARGSSGTLTGYFTQVIWKGLVPPDGSSSGIPYLGATSIALVN